MDRMTYYEYDNGIPARVEGDSNVIELFIGGEWEQRSFMGAMYKIVEIDRKKFNALLELEKKESS